MAIVYPLSLPAGLKFTETEWDPLTVVGFAQSPMTFQSQTFVWPGQAWVFRGRCKPVKDSAAADDIIAFQLALNGRQGYFSMGDATRTGTRGSAAGAWVVGAAAVALSTTLPIAGGTGAFAVGDWLQVGTYLHRIIKLVDAANVDVWPRLRAAYAPGTVITYANPKGLFRLEDNSMRWNINLIKHHAFELRAMEYL